MQKDSGKRARSDEDKKLKADYILKKTDELFQSEEYSQITMSRIACASSVAKGTVFNYFTTKEELFLQLAGRYFHEIFEDLKRELNQNISGGSSEELSKFLVSLIVSRPLFRKIVVLLDSIIEKNVTQNNLEIFKQTLVKEIFDSGFLMEEKYAFLPKGAGPRFLMWIYGIIIGFQNLADPEEAVKKVIEENNLDLFRFSFEEELTRVIQLMLKGFISE